MKDYETNLNNIEKKQNSNVKDYVLVTNGVGKELKLQCFNPDNKNVHLIQFLKLII